MVLLFIDVKEIGLLLKLLQFVIASKVVVARKNTFRHDLSILHKQNTINQLRE